MATRQLKPEYMLNGCGFTFGKSTQPELDTETSSFDEELEKSHRELGEALEEQRKERWDYLIDIDRMQNVREALPWPYDLCKMAGDNEDTLQWAREYDHYYDYVRDNPKYEYDPGNYLNIKKLPKYDYTVNTFSQDDNEEKCYNSYDHYDYDSDSDQECLPDYSKFKSFLLDYGNDIADDEGWTTVEKK